MIKSGREKEAVGGQKICCPTYHLPFTPTPLLPPPLCLPDCRDVKERTLIGRSLVAEIDGLP